MIQTSVTPRLRDSGTLGAPRRPLVPKVPRLRRADDTAAAAVSMTTETKAVPLQATIVNKSSVPSSSLLRDRLAASTGSSTQSEQVLIQSRVGEDALSSSLTHSLTRCGLAV